MVEAFRWCTCRCPLCTATLQIQTGSQWTGNKCWSENILIKLFATIFSKICAQFISCIWTNQRIQSTFVEMQNWLSVFNHASSVMAKGLIVLVPGLPELDSLQSLKGQFWAERTVRWTRRWQWRPRAKWNHRHKGSHCSLLSPDLFDKNYKPCVKSLHKVWEK